MKSWLIRLCLGLVLLGCLACGSDAKKDTSPPDPKAKPESPPPPPPLPKGPPKDAPAK